MNSRRFTLLEVVIAVALTAIVMGATYHFLLGAQRQASSSAANQTTLSQARRAAHEIARELRGANFTAIDFPDTPSAASSVRYRAITGYDTGAKKTLLSPSRASGDFRELRFASGVITREDPSGTTYELARRIANLELTLLAPNRLLIRVSASATDSQGDAVTNTAEIQIVLSNGTDDAV